MELMALTFWWTLIEMLRLLLRYPIREWVVRSRLTFLKTLNFLLDLFWTDFKIGGFMRSFLFLCFFLEEKRENRSFGLVLFFPIRFQPYRLYFLHSGFLLTPIGLKLNKIYKLIHLSSPLALLDFGFYTEPKEYHCWWSGGERSHFAS